VHHREPPEPGVPLMAAPLSAHLGDVLSWAQAPTEAAIDQAVAAASARVASTAATADELARLVACIDLTTLEGSDTPARVTTMAGRAVRPDPDDPGLGPVAAVCVYPSLVAAAVAATAGSPVVVASVAGAFPSGQSPLSVRLADIEAAVAAGAQEIDIVLNRGAFLAGDLATAHADIVASVAAAQGWPVKVILETGELGSNQAIATAAVLAMAAGADFVKTSTGKIPVSATPPAVVTMAEAVARFKAETGRAVGIKVSGGLRVVDDARLYAALVANRLGPDELAPARFRFGASRLLDALVEARAAVRTG
jgi:deoxyribose-phosphate aldolase